MSACRLLLALTLLGAVACHTEPAVEDELVSGCVSTDHTLLEDLAACTRRTGALFVFDHEVEREMARMTSTWTVCFVPEGTKRSEIGLPDTVEMVQQRIWAARSRGGRDLMIDRDPLPGTNTYRIYRLPRGS